MTEVEAPHNPEFKRIRFKGKVQRNSEPQHGDKTSNSPADHAVTCPECGSNSLYRDGQRYYPDGSVFQRWLCRNCNYRFTEKPPKENSKWSINTKTAIVSKRQICATIEEAKNLDTATEAKTVAGMGQIADADVKGKLIQFALYCQKDGLSDSTVKTFNTALRSIARHANINDPENVKEALAKMNLVENTKFVYSCAYTKFLTFLGKTWTPPKYEYIEKLPEFLPTEAEIDALITGSAKRLSALLQLMKETGMRLGECLSLTWACINFDMRTITLRKAEKHSSPRVFTVSTTLINMLSNLRRENEKVFGRMNKSSATWCLINQRRRIAHRLSNPRVAKIHFHLIRHWYATMQYHKKPDIFYISKLLGHKSVLTTQIYVNLEKMAFGESSNDYIVKVVATVEEACKLLEVGFEYVTEMEGQKLFRKRK